MSDFLIFFSTFPHPLPVTNHDMKTIQLVQLWKFIQIHIRDTDPDSDSCSLFQVIAHSNLLFNNNSYKKSLSALKAL